MAWCKCAPGTIRQRGFITLSLIGYVAIGGALALALAIGAATIQTKRLNAANDRIASMVAAAKAQEEAVKLKTSQDAKLKQEKDNEQKRRYAALELRHKRLLDGPGSNVLPPAPAPGSPDGETICFGRAQLAGALGKFVADTSRIALEGDQAIGAVNLSREWVQELMRR